MKNSELSPAKNHFYDSFNERLMFRSETKISEKNPLCHISPFFQATPQRWHGQQQQLQLSLLQQQLSALQPDGMNLYTCVALAQLLSNVFKARKMLCKVVQATNQGHAVYFAPLGLLLQHQPPRVINSIKIMPKFKIQNLPMNLQEFDIGGDKKNIWVY